MNKNVTKTVPQILKDNICTVFNLLNFLIAIALAAVGAWKNILFILVILINTAVGIVQEIKAKRQIEKLTLLSLPKVKIFKDGKELNISPDEIKKGDILCLESGSVICCDSRIVSGAAELNEAILTGESEPVQKGSGDLLLSGSSVISGRCRAEVICENDESFTSKMVDELKSTKQSGSEMLMSMKKVTKFTSFFIVPLGILMFVQGYFFRDMPVAEAVISTSAGLLGMLPKGLVLLISIGFATGVISLSKKRVLVRELHSLENLAHCDTVCLDKTGTLTEGKLSVEKVTADIDEKEFEKLMSTYLKFTDDNNSTYLALKKYFKCTDSYNCVACEPFSSERKYSSVTMENGTAFVIGAPEKLCKTVPYEAYDLMAAGKRVLFAAFVNGEVVPENAEIAGMIVISDKIRKNAKETVKYFYSQGIDIKIISGDNPCAASAIAQSAGVKNADLYIDMSEAADGDMEVIAEKYTVFGRVTPGQKKMLIEAMQKRGHKVAMTGDGVNDLLAMRCADCSAAMGSGCDAAKQTAQLVLIDSDFSVLKDVISEGRRVINNITKSAGVFFIKTIYSVLLCILCLLLNEDFPFIPIQITLIDAAIETFPAFFMSFEENDKKCEGSFLQTAVKEALPNGIAVFLCCAVLSVLSGFIGLEKEQSTLLMYLSVGIISLAGVVKASLPLNLYRGMLALISAVGFVCAVILFSSFLQLAELSVPSAAVFPAVIIPGLIFAAVVKLS